MARLASGGVKVRAGGTAPVCAKADRIFLSVAIVQGKRTARGSWAKHVCTGSQQHWKLTATSTSGALHKGNATGHGVAVIKHNGRVVKTRRWSAKLTLK